MPAANSMLGLFGLATRRQLESAVDRKDRWHGLVRNIFVPYYLKFQETALGNMPELPARYSPEWDNHIQAELDRFLALDLESVGSLLEAAGFGTEKWERLQETGFPALSRLLDEATQVDEATPDHPVQAAAIESAVNEDVLDLLSRHPDLMQEIAERFDPASGTLRLTEQDIAASRSYQKVQTDLEQARAELRRFRRGGQRALARMRQLEAELHAGNGNGRVSDPVPEPMSEPMSGAVRPAAADAEHVREIAGLHKQLRARDAAVSTLRARVEELENEASKRPDPDVALAERASWLERELESRDDQVVRLQGQIEKLQDALDTQGTSADQSVEDASRQTDAAEPEGVEAAALQDLRNDLKTRDHTIAALRAEVERLQAQTGPGAPGQSEAAEDAGAEIKQLRSDLKGREHTIESLRAELEKLSAQDAGARSRDEAPEEDLTEQLQQLQADVKAREHTIESLREQISRLEADAERASTRPARESDAEPGSDGVASLRPREPAAPDRQEEIDALQRDLRAREITISTLREQLETFERELGQAREQLMAEVKKLAALAAGDVELKPSEELDELGADELMDYARTVAEDLDVRRQTLDEGLQGVESVKGSYEDTKRLFEQQQLDMEAQLEQLRTEVDTYREQESNAEEGSLADLRHTMSKQRDQLELLATRVRQLVSTNKDLNDSNKKMYSNLEEAVKKVIPLRRQIEELENLQDTLQKYIRSKFDRTFTMRQLKESGIR